MNILLILAFLFFLGSIFGFLFELVFRRFFTNKKWINPGFLTGPYLPIYGFGACGLYLLSRISLPINFFSESIIIIFLMTFVMVLVEFLSGLFCIKYMHVRLWDYSDQLLNYKGIICLLFTIIWGVIAALYYFFIDPIIVNAIIWIDSNLEFSFVIGLFFGIFIIDVVISTNMIGKLRKFAIKNEITLAYDNLKKFFMEKNDKKYYIKHRQSKIRELLDEYLKSKKV